VSIETECDGGSVDSSQTMSRLYSASNNDGLNITKSVTFAEPDEDKTPISAASFMDKIQIFIIGSSDEETVETFQDSIGSLWTVDNTVDSFSGRPARVYSVRD